jgi:SAM-dependent methyltransferase
MPAGLCLVRSCAVWAESARALRCPLGCGPLQPDEQTLRDNRFGLAYEVRIAWCPACGLGVTLDPPPAEELAGLYEREYPEHGRVPGTSRAARVWHAVNGSLPLVERVHEGPVLDVGCHTGETLVALRERGFEVVGLEPNPRAAERTRARGLEVISAPIEEAELPAGSFRSVLLSQVLEHVEDPAAVLAATREALAAAGTAFVVVPNAESAWRRLFGRHWAHWHVPFHLYHHTERSLRKLLGQSGFRVSRLQTVTPGEFVLLSIDAWRNARRGRHELEPFEGRYTERMLAAPPARLLDAVGRGDALYAEATPG